MKIIEKFLHEEYFQELKSIVFSKDFLWNFSEVSVYNSQQEIEDLTNHQFSHVLYENSKPCSKFYENFSIFFGKLNCSVLLRAKINLNVNVGSIKEKPYHTDIPTFISKNINYNTGIFYFDTNNGYTKFKDDTIVQSVENRFLYFDGYLPHCGASCTDSKKRVVLNINWI